MIQVRWLGQADYLPTYEAMQAFTAERTEATEDELWLCEHPPVFTQGLAGKADHLLMPGNIPVVQTNRGGQVTYHGPGQVVAYPLIDLQRLHIFVKEYVYRLEHCVIKVLESFGVTGHRVAGAPGVYVRLADPFGHARVSGESLAGLAKIAALSFTVPGEVDAYGVCAAMSMHNPTHELVAEKAIAMLDPKPVFCSHRISRLTGMHERAATAGFRFG